MDMIRSDTDWMKLALRLAARGRTSPNPRVGAVVVHHNEVLATGYHRAAGQPHGEVEALAKLNFHAPGASLYVNLEPCSHFGRTPPCTDAIIRSGIRRVVGGIIDPNPIVRGRGFQNLRDAGITVESGILEPRCREINAGFIKFMTTGLPFITLKVATTADGHTATVTGDARWISSPESRKHVHRQRYDADAILVGIGSVLKDDPQLTVRDISVSASYQPTRIIFDSRLCIPLTARVLNADAPTLVVTCEDSSVDKALALEKRGVTLVRVPAEKGRVNISDALRQLAQRGFLYIFAEPGATLAAALAFNNVVDRYHFYVAPRLVGGVTAPPLLGGEGIALLRDATCLRWTNIKRIGPDILLEAVPDPMSRLPSEEAGVTDR